MKDPIKKNYQNLRSQMDPRWSRQAALLGVSPRGQSTLSEAAVCVHSLNRSISRIFVKNMLLLGIGRVHLVAEEVKDGGYFWQDDFFIQESEALGPLQVANLMKFKMSYLNPFASIVVEDATVSGGVKATEPVRDDFCKRASQPFPVHLREVADEPSRDSHISQFPIDQSVHLSRLNDMCQDGASEADHVQRKAKSKIVVAGSYNVSKYSVEPNQVLIQVEPSTGMIRYSEGGPTASPSICSLSASLMAHIAVKIILFRQEIRDGSTIGHRLSPKSIYKVDSTNGVRCLDE